MKKRKVVKGELFEVPKIKKRLFLKTLVTLSFFLGANFVTGKLTYKDPLPYKDDQELPDENNQNNNDIIEQLEMQLALDAYEHLLGQLYQKASHLGVELSSDYLIKMISYDNMTDTIEVVLQNQNKTAILKFPANNLEKVEIKENMKLSDQVSELALLLNAPLLEVPIVNNFNFTLNKKLNDYVASGIKYYASTNMQFSDGNYRNELMDDSLFAGRDYLFFNVYGKGYKNEIEYDVVTIISMTKDDYEILGEPNLVNYYLNNPEDSRFSVNVFYQENQKTLEKLNNQITKDNSLEK